MDAETQFKDVLFETVAEHGGQITPPTQSAIDLNAAIDPRQAIEVSDPLSQPDTTETEQTIPVGQWADGQPIHADDLPRLIAMNGLYCHAKVGGKNVIVGRRFCQVQGMVITFESPAEFKKGFLHERNINGKNPGQAWLEWAGKNFKPGGTGFFPVPKQCPADVFNFYRGLQVKPLEGDCAIYLNHLKQVICGGDEASYRYLLQWMAHLFQKPNIKPSVAIVLKSVEGTGKGTMAEPLLRILGPHGNKTNGAYAIVSRFNSTIANKLFIFGDEVELTGKREADPLKSLISEPSVNMERKGFEIEPLPNYCRFIFASNHTRVISAGVRERRYLVLEPSDTLAQNRDYFKNLWAWINGNGPAYLLHYLLRLDLSDFDPYRCPQTAALIAEKLGNLHGVNQFFYTEITKAEPFSGRVRINATELVDDFIRWSTEEGEKVNKPTASSSVGRMMAKLGVTVYGRSDRGGKYYDLPGRVVLVQQFAKLLDIPVEALEL